MSTHNIIMFSLLEIGKILCRYPLLSGATMDVGKGGPEWR